MAMSKILGGGYLHPNMGVRGMEYSCEHRAFIAFPLGVTWHNVFCISSVSKASNFVTSPLNYFLRRALLQPCWQIVIIGLTILCSYYSVYKQILYELQGISHPAI